MVGVIPCIHAIGLHELLRLYQEGTRALIVSTGECDACMRGQVPRLFALVNQLNELLESRDLVTIGISAVPRLEWAETVLDALHEAREVQMSRRHFLRGAVRGVAEDRARLTGLTADEAEGALPPGKLLPMSDRRGLAPFFPSIDETRCNGCDACAQVCPHGSIVLERDAAGVPSRYRLDPELCTGCAICVDACDQEAVDIAQWVVQYQHEVCLENTRCRACGAPYHLPVGCSMEEGRLCRICASANHYSKLYQVLD